jgi:general secretion pathway protein B
MSLILDALQKADRDRKQHDAPPSIGSQYQTHPDASPNKKWLRLTIAIGILITLCILIALFLLDDKTSKSAPTVGLTEQTPSNDAGSDTQGLADAKQTQKAKAEAKTKTKTNATTKKSGVTQAIEKAASATQASSNTHEESSAVAKLYNDINDAEKPNEEAPISSTNLNQTRSDNTSETTKKTQVNKASNLTQFEHLDLIKELPFSIQEQIPTLIYSAHDFNNNGKSAVILNGKRYVEGSKIDANITIERILEDGTILRFRDYQFKMYALNSWLNF